LDKHNTTKKISHIEYFAKGSVIALVIASSTLSAFFISWYLFDEIIIAAVIGLVAHFISMGFSIKLAKKLSKEQQS